MLCSYVTAGGASRSGNWTTSGLVERGICPLTVWSAGVPASPHEARTRMERPNASAEELNLVSPETLVNHVRDTLMLSDEVNSASISQPGRGGGVSESVDEVMRDIFC